MEKGTSARTLALKGVNCDVSHWLERITKQREKGVVNCDVSHWLERITKKREKGVDNIC